MHSYVTDLKECMILLIDFHYFFPANLITKEENIIVKEADLLQAKYSDSTYLNFQLGKLFFSKNDGKFKKQQLSNPQIYFFLNVVISLVVISFTNLDVWFRRWRKPKLASQPDE